DVFFLLLTASGLYHQLASSNLCRSLSSRTFNSPHSIFLDKLSKSNYYLELMTENIDAPIDDCLINLSGDLLSNGGQ
ncbi:hypothetical protein BDQ12DRAFT_756548, partial [Crucibulum laeve]